MIKRNPTIRTRNRIEFSLVDPRAEDVQVEDISHALSQICRFNGHTSEFYSVAQHCCLVCDHCEANPKHGLLHDAAEAYVGDVSRPLRQAMGLLGLESFDKIESRVWSAICARFGISFTIPADVKLMDNRALQTEWEAFVDPIRRRPVQLTGDGRLDLKGPLVAWEPKRAKLEWEARFRALFSETGSAA